MEIRYLIRGFVHNTLHMSCSCVCLASSDQGGWAPKIHIPRESGSCRLLRSRLRNWHCWANDMCSLLSGVEIWTLLPTASWYQSCQEKHNTIEHSNREETELALVVVVVCTHTQWSLLQPTQGNSLPTPLFCCIRRTLSPPT